MHKLIVLGMIALCAGCSLSDGGDVVVSTVQPGLRLDLIQPLNEASRFGMSFTTTDEACGSAKLLADGLVQDEMVHVEISGLLVPSTCAAEKEFIAKEIPMDVPRGTYDLRIDIGEELTNLGFLTFDGESYHLEIDEPHGLYIGHGDMNLIPENIVWGELVSEESVEDVIDDFRSVTSSFTSPLGLKDGYYAHFIVESGSGINISSDLNESNGYVYPFVFRLKSDTYAFQDILNTFRTEYSDLIEINCTTWTGKQL